MGNYRVPHNYLNLRSEFQPAKLIKKFTYAYSACVRQAVEHFSSQTHPQFLKNLNRLRFKRALEILLIAGLDKKGDMPNGIRNLTGLKNLPGLLTQR